MRLLIKLQSGMIYRFIEYLGLDIYLFVLFVLFLFIYLIFKRTK